METDHRQKIEKQYRNLDLPTIKVLHIPDDYEYMDEELVDLLNDRINEAFQIAFGT